MTAEADSYPQKTPVIGTPISMTSYDEVMSLLRTPPANRTMTVAVCTVHALMALRRDPALSEAIHAADIATPDGVPLVWAIRWTANPAQQRVYGPELMRRTLISESPEYSHYLYGSTPETVERLTARIGEFAPMAKIVGAESPPFREPTPDEEAATLERIRTSGATIVWVGLGQPKQELWMLRVTPHLQGVALVGVGAAFDFLSGTKAQAPGWIQRAGLEWLFRLFHEPHRLWRRYLFNNPAYLALLARQVAATRLKGLNLTSRKSD